jgi:hypothetical protein
MKTKINLPYYVRGSRSEFGKSRTLIKCPFCGEEVWAYNWSLAGCGKRCPGCGAKHTMYHGTVLEKEVPDREASGQQ